MKRRSIFGQEGKVACFSKILDPFRLVLRPFLDAHISSVGVNCIHLVMRAGLVHTSALINELTAVFWSLALVILSCGKGFLISL